MDEKILEAPLFVDIRHSIQYRYPSSVFLEPLTLRLRPRSNVCQRLIFFDLDILPRPAGRSDSIGLEGNSSTSLWFEGTVDQLSIVTTSRVETLCADPFGFIITAQSADRLPAVYPEGMRSLLEPYLCRIDPCEELEAFAAHAVRESDGRTVSFLCALVRLISDGFTKVVRRTGSPEQPSVTLKQGRGACRDLTVLFMDICRSVGLASRFVSGYTESDETGSRRELHAWAEVYLPGGGWRGFDPTLGLAVADRHVAIAASPGAEGASPTSGTFRGDSVSSTMEYEVSMVWSERERNTDAP